MTKFTGQIINHQSQPVENIRIGLCAAKSCSLPSPSFALPLPMNGRGGVKLATIIEQQGCEVRYDSQRVSSGEEVPEGGLGGCAPSLSLAP